MAGITKDEVKALLQIKSTTKDEYLNAVLPLVEEHVKEYCNRDFLDDSGNLNYPGGVKLAIAKWCQAYMRDSRMESETVGRWSGTYSQGGVPSEVATILSGYRRPKLVPIRGRIR